ncbi:MAG: hypothetical protein JNL24_00670 [Bacteroidia bacterium]|nr:hypothetical protein [Bacteroidia bacterium]
MKALLPLLVLKHSSLSFLRRGIEGEVEFAFIGVTRIDLPFQILAGDNTCKSFNLGKKLKTLLPLLALKHSSLSFLRRGTEGEVECLCYHQQMNATNAIHKKGRIVQCALLT